MMRQVLQRPRIYVAVILLLAATGAFAQAAGAPNGATALGMLGQAFASINNAISALATNTWARGAATQTSVALLAMLLIWGILKSLILGKGLTQLIADFMQPLIMFAIVTAAITQGFGESVNATVDTIATGVSSSMGVSPKSEIEIMNDFASTAFKVFDLNNNNPVGFSWQMFEAAIAYTIGLFMKLFSFLIILVCGALAAGLLFLSKVMVAIALGLGPILYVWGIWKPTEFLFTGWLRFLISAGLQKVVIGLLAGFVSVGLNQMSALSNSLTGQITTDVVAYGVLLLFSVLSAMLLYKAPSIAEGLLSGGGGMDTSRWTVVSTPVGNTAGSAGRAADRGAGAAIGGVMSGIKKGWGGQGAASTGGASSTSSAGGGGYKTASQYAGAAAMGAVKGAASSVGSAARTLTKGGGNP